VEAINEILVADTDLEAGAKDSDFENEFEDCEDEHEQASAQQDEAQTATSGEASPTWGPLQARNIHPFVGPAKGLKNSEASHINKDSSPLSVLMLFFTQIFQLVEQTNLYYQQHLDRQARPSR
jgi:hypothetical protein